MTTLKLTRDHYTIGLDARRDLFVAGLPCDDGDVEEFVERYVEAAEKIAAERGVTIDVVTGEAGDDDDEAGDLWQAIHNRAA